MPSTFPTVAPGPGPDAALGEVAARGRGGRPVAHRRVGTHRGVPDDDVEEDGRRDQGYAGHAHVEADALLFQEANDAFRRGEPERASAGKQQGVCGTDGTDGPESVRLARAWRGAAHVNADDGPLGVLEEDGGAARCALRSVAWPTSTPGTSQRLSGMLALGVLAGVSGTSHSSVSAGMMPGLSLARAPSEISSWSERFVPNWTRTESLTIE